MALRPQFRRPLLRAAALASLTVMAAGCSHRPGGGRIEVTYKKDTPEKEKPMEPSHYSGPASGVWCPGAHRLEITSVHEDMGFGHRHLSGGLAVGRQLPRLRSGHR